MEHEIIPDVNYLQLHGYLAKESLTKFTDNEKSFKEFDFSKPLFVYTKGHTSLTVFYIKSTYYVNRVMLKEYLKYEVSHTSYFSEGNPEKLIDLVYPIAIKNLLE